MIVGSVVQEKEASYFVISHPLRFPLFCLTVFGDVLASEEWLSSRLLYIGFLEFYHFLHIFASVLVYVDAPVWGCCVIMSLILFWQGCS